MHTISLLSIVFHFITTMHTISLLFFFFRDFIFKKTLFEKLQYLKQEQYYFLLYFILSPRPPRTPHWARPHPQHHGGERAGADAAVPRGGVPPHQGDLDPKQPAPHTATEGDRWEIGSSYQFAARANKNHDPELVFVEFNMYFKKILWNEISVIFDYSKYVSCWNFQPIICLVLLSVSIVV